MKRRPLATRNAVLVAALLAVALIATGALEIWASHRERQASLEALQREKAHAASQAVARFVEDVTRSLVWPTLSAAAPDDLQRWRTEFQKIVRLEPAVTSLSLVGPDGRERLRVSRVTPDRFASGIDHGGAPEFGSARRGRISHGAVRFVGQSEPYFTIAVPNGTRDGFVVLAEVNLKFVADVVSAIRIGETGYAYVVDSNGRLVAHPDLDLVLQMRDVSGLPQVRAAAGQAHGFHPTARNLSSDPVLAAHAVIEPLSWIVFVEQTAAEARAPLMASIIRTGSILAVALVLTLVAGVTAARRMVAPVAALRSGAQRFGAGDLDHRIVVASGDELEDLASQFNAMGAQLRDTYADLERRVAERTRELDVANQAKSRFLAAASHDLRQPMHALALFVGQLNESRKPAERAALVQRIGEAVGSLSELLDQLLDLTRLEAGTMGAAQEPFDLDSVLRLIERQLAPMARAHALELRVQSRPAWLRSDPHLVQRILLNLVSNAIQHTKRGGVLVAARRRGGRVRIAVWDTGCGISQESHDDIFREFVQLGDDRSRARGLGLGLAIVARLADLLGTRVELRSRLGHGSMFAFELPLVTKPSALQHLRAALPPVVDLGGVFVLVIDDDEAARAGTCGLLEQWGCLTLGAASGSAATVQLGAHDRPPEVIVCDYRLGCDESGLEAIGRIRAALQAQVPALLVTADTTSAVASAAQSLGVPLLHKPVSPLKLRALLGQLLSRRANESGARVETGVP